MFGKRKPEPELVTEGHFELARDGHLATLRYTVAGKVLALIHTEIPESLRSSGVASILVKTALDWARQNGMKVDVVCPFVAAYLERHPEYSELMLR